MNATRTPPTQEQREAGLEAKRRAESPNECLQIITEGYEGYAGRAEILARLEEMPQTSRLTYVKAMQGKSPVPAIKAFCMMCVGWVRQEATLCTDPACPLYPYRPFQD